ncbi:alpha/beta fold hydrolase [Erythrobacter gaetbuli]|uniref:Alpha/beta fold hydrolase n=2 Tax=Qipengyuania gaetbuli TaxID=266952 RepID=A0A844XWC7_9SPHN|nr:alpha/beta hydrolase [Qipengyuania gaetbuli]MXO49874.1 alpha/beta fold hydrolase [Qipengyuania gaetbuli]
MPEDIIPDATEKIARTAIDRRAIPAHANESVWTAADGHALRRIDWPGAQGSPRGSILFLPGRGDFYEKYLETLEEWHRAGWRVTAADWRGQAGSGRLGDDAVTGHVGDFSDWVDDLAHLWRDWTAQTPGPHILAAHSMGGHIVMRALVDGAVLPDAVVLSAPMLGMSGPPLPLPLLHGVAKVMTKVGEPTRPAWKWSEKPGEIPARRRDLLTHDGERYADELWWREKRPELVMGPGSWGWVERAYASTRAIEASGAMEGIDVPVLIVSTANDKLVSHAAAKRAAERLPRGELVEFGSEAHHEIFREVPAVRNRALDAVSEFLDRVAPAAS